MQLAAAGKEKNRLLYIQRSPTPYLCTHISMNGCHSFSTYAEQTEMLVFRKILRTY